MIHQLTTWIEQLAITWVGGLEQSGYWGIFLMMAIESSFIPFPSEIVMLPAGHLAAEGKFSVAPAIAAGTAGSLVGALVNYYLALLLGRTFLDRFGKYLFLPQEKLLWADRKWNQYGEVTTFTCRLLPAIRQLISIPAGLARMNLFRFCLWTTLGAGLWVTVLTVTGYLLGERAELLWQQRRHEITIGLFLIAIAVLGIWLVARQTRSRMRHTGVVESTASPPAP